MHSTSADSSRVNHIRPRDASAPPEARVVALIVPLVLALLFLGALSYGPHFRLPFLADDYVFLDRVIHSNFAGLWSRTNTDFGWYRPWSRELHFWCIERIAGLEPAAFRVVGLLLWTASLLLYAALLARVVPRRAAIFATLGASAQALWGTPIVWISGSQDLWMLLFSMLALLAVVSGRNRLALLPAALALLSKETAGVLPILAFGAEVFVRRTPAREALRRTAPLILLVVAWVVLHPTLLDRLFGPEYSGRVEVATRPRWPVVLTKSILSLASLERLPAPEGLDLARARAIGASALVIALVAALAARDRTPAPGEARAASFGILWTLAGEPPAFLPSIGWHAYYACLGTLGALLLLGLGLARLPRAAPIALALAVFLRGANAATPASDWGSVWYHERAGRILADIRKELLYRHPVLPPYSRVYFGHVPNNIGLVAGQSPALRVWYRDSTLRAGFYSYYRARDPRAPMGRDYFFVFDSVRVLTEVVAGPEDIPEARALNPNWGRDHENLAALLIGAGEARPAAVEYEKLSEAYPTRPDFALYAAAAFVACGDSARARPLRSAAAHAYGDSAAAALIGDLLASLPRAAP